MKMEDVKTRTLTIPNVPDETFDQLNKGINDWINSGERMVMSSESVHKKELIDCYNGGYERGSNDSKFSTMMISGAILFLAPILVKMTMKIWKQIQNKKGVG